MAVTAGYITEQARGELYSVIDAANVDLKAFTEEFYHRTCAAHLADVLDTLRYLRHETDVWLEITTLLIPGRNDSDTEIETECAWILNNLGPDVPLHFTAFHPDYKMIDVPPTPPAVLTRARTIALRQGLHHVYTGNVYDSAGGCTFCSGCGRAVVVRNWYRMVRYELTDDGACLSCGARLAGVFDGPVGHWGPRRLTLFVGGA